MHKYRLISVKGEGTFSEVMKAQSVKNGKCVAMKCMKSRFKSLQQVNNLREIQALRRLSPHAHIIKLHEVLYDHPSGRLALVFELMDCNIYELIKGRKQYLREEMIRGYMYQLIKAMEHMHRNGVFHRDIKPENILLVDKVLKLADFGSCRGIYSKQPYTEYISTRWYRAPECLLTDGYYGYKMDMWGIGCVIFEVLALFPLFPGKDEADQIERIHKILGTPPAPILAKFQKYNTRQRFNFRQHKGTGIKKLIPHVSREAIDLITKLLAYDPEERISAKHALRHPWFADIRAEEKRRRAAAKTKEGGKEEGEEEGGGAAGGGGEVVEGGGGGGGEAEEKGVAAPAVTAKQITPVERKAEGSKKVVEKHRGEEEGKHGEAAGGGHGHHSHHGDGKDGHTGKGEHGRLGAATGATGGSSGRSGKDGGDRKDVRGSATHGGSTTGGAASGTTSTRRRGRDPVPMSAVDDMVDESAKGSRGVGGASVSPPPSSLSPGPTGRRFAPGASPMAPSHPQGYGSTDSAAARAAGKYLSQVGGGGTGSSGMGGTGTTSGSTTWMRRPYGGGGAEVRAMARVQADSPADHPAAAGSVLRARRTRVAPRGGMRLTALGGSGHTEASPASHASSYGYSYGQTATHTSSTLGSSLMSPVRGSIPLQRSGESVKRSGRRVRRSGARRSQGSTTSSYGSGSKYGGYGGTSTQTGQSVYGGAPSAAPSRSYGGYGGASYAPSGSTHPSYAHSPSPSRRLAPMASSGGTSTGSAYRPPPGLSLAGSYNTSSYPAASRAPDGAGTIRASYASPSRRYPAASSGVRLSALGQPPSLGVGGARARIRS